MRNNRLLRNIRLGIKTLLLHKLRSLLTMLGVVFGVGSVIAMLAVGEGASREALEQIRRLGSQNIIIDGPRPDGNDDRQRGTETRLLLYGLHYADLDRLQEGFPDITRAVPVKWIQREGRIGAQAMTLRMVGTTPEWFDLVNRPMLDGRAFSALDLERRANVAVLTEHAARRLFAAARDGLGSQIRIGGTTFTIAGIVQSESSTAGGIQTPDRNTDLYVPITTARERFGDAREIRSGGSRSRELVELNQIIVEIDRPENVEPNAAAIEAMLARFHARTSDYRIHVPLALLRQAEATRRNFNIVLGAIAGISLLVGGIGIMNIMLASVTERTREIGVRRAIGAKQRQIVYQFLIETIVLSTTGGAIGVAVGLLIPWIITRTVSMPTYVTPISVVLALGVSMMVGIVFGIYPAIRAARLDPIEALRHE